MRKYIEHTQQHPAHSKVTGVVTVPATVAVVAAQQRTHFLMCYGSELEKH